MNKKLILLAAPHVAVGAIAIWAAWKAHEANEDSASGMVVSHLEDAIIRLEKDVEKLEKRVDAAEFKMIAVSSSGDEALTKVAKVEKDLRLHSHYFLEKDVKELKDEVSYLKLEVLNMKINRK